MEYTDTGELTLEKMKEELVRVEEAKRITEEYLKEMESLSSNTITELTKLKRNLDLLKQFEKLVGKKEYLVKLEQRVTDFETAITLMEKNNLTIYNPLK